MDNIRVEVNTEIYDFDDYGEAIERAKHEAINGNEVYVTIDNEIDDDFELWKDCQ